MSLWVEMEDIIALLTEVHWSTEATTERGTATTHSAGHSLEKKERQRSEIDWLALAGEFLLLGLAHSV